MCFYITATLPKETDFGILEEIVQKYDMSFDRINNDVIQSQLRQGELYFRATKTLCDCDSIIGILDKSGRYHKLLNSKKVKKLKSKKWSSEQIDIWINEKIQGDNSQFKKLTNIEKSSKLKRWETFITEILTSKNIERIGILKHWYSTSLSDEEFNIKGIKHIHIDKLNHELLLNLELDILYEFRPVYTH